MRAHRAFSLGGAVRPHDCALRRTAFAARTAFWVPWTPLKSYAYLFEGLTVRRVLVVTVICASAAALVVRTFLNTYPDLLVSALCVGYTSMLLFTMGGNLRQSRLKQIRGRATDLAKSLVDAATS